MGIQMKRKELTKTIMMNSNLKKTRLIESSTCTAQISDTDIIIL